MAINRRWLDEAGAKQEATDWFQIVAWGQRAENCLAHLSKGRRVFVTGWPRIQQWKEKGRKRERLQVLADQIIFLDSPKPDQARLPENTTE